MRGGRGGWDGEEKTDRERWIGMGDGPEFVALVAFLTGTGSCKGVWEQGIFCIDRKL